MTHPITIDAARLTWDGRTPTGTELRAWLESLPGSEFATGLLILADALDREPTRPEPTDIGASDAMDSDLREVIRRRIELRERDGHERLLLNHVDLRALLDAADERDRLAGNRREPRDLDWDRSVDSYHAAGWVDEPGDYERMFFESGWRAAIRALDGADS